ncbi:MAG: GLPGLI family protein [Flavobacteriaceae bacterium]|nr:GLPGLI family protein [Flavobacteriaceae bacterium]
MTRIVSIVMMGLMFITTSVMAQDFQGVATYKSKRKMDIKMDSTQMDGDMQKQMMEMLTKQFEKTYKLTFNKEESLYKEEEKLEAPQTSGMQIVIAGAGGSDVLYRNVKEQRYTNQNELMGKVFLIQDQLKPTDWVLGSETKNIGNYTCYKATSTREQEVRESRMSVNGDNHKEENEKAEPKMETITITAWYTPQIPINSGPGNYYGLPGLILEVNDGSETVICSKIVMNPKDNVRISEPTKGKVITQVEFNEVMEKKMKEMEERYNSNRKGDGHGVQIRIGG